MSTISSDHGAVYDRGYRPYDGPRGLQGAATLALYKASIRRALGIRRSWRQKFAPFVLLGIVTIPAIVNVGIGYVTRDRLENTFEIVTYRDYVGVSSALLLFVALVAPGCHVPRPSTARPAADVRSAADRGRLRHREGRSDRLDPLRVLVPTPGRAVPWQHARQRQCLRVLHGSPRRAVEDPNLSARDAGDLLRGAQCRNRVADRPSDRRRRRPSSASC